MKRLLNALKTIKGINIISRPHLDFVFINTDYDEFLPLPKKFLKHTIEKLLLIYLDNIEKGARKEIGETIKDIFEYTKVPKT